MSRTQNLRWKRKAIALAAVAVSFGGYSALTGGTVSAANYSEWDCSGSSSVAAVAVSNDDPCPVTSDAVTSDTSVDTVPQDTTPVDTTPVDTTPVRTDPATTQPATTQPTGEQLPPAPTTKPTTPAPAVAPAAAASPQVAPANVLPVTGRGSALPTMFIAIGLLGTGSVALAFARRNQAARNNQS
ncbi:MAG: hypothetical protein JWN99_2038 [Ilumatobacteraceae bacterium]|nr:hypothetical protein [Ilumatobacteraceae bacterium]